MNALYLVSEFNTGDTKFLPRLGHDGRGWDWNSFTPEGFGEWRRGDMGGPRE